MVDARLEDALRFAGQSGDIASLQALARAESQAKFKMQRLFVAMLERYGPTTFDVSVTSGSTDFSYTVDIIDNNKATFKAGA